MAARNSVATIGPLVISFCTSIGVALRPSPDPCLPGWGSFSTQPLGFALKREVTDGQERPSEKGPFRLQVDRQTKDSYATYEEAEEVGLALKKRSPIVQVTIWDTVKGERKIIELPK
jgi:hypothetical protein